MYEKLKLEFDIPDFIEEDIDKIMNYINVENPKRPEDSDCLRTELNCDINYCIRENILTREHAEILKDYYVHGEVYKKE